MIRTFATAVITIVAISTGLVWAQGPGAPGQGRRIPVTAIGGTPGATVEFYMDAGKLADATVDSTGNLDWVLDLSNTPKTKVTVYVDVCKDGKIVKVMFVSGTGQAPPEQDDCNRRLAALSFQSDCSGLHVNLDFANFGASRAIGCGMSFRNPKVIGTVGGVLIGAVALTAGGGGSTTSTASSTPTGVSSTPTPPAAPPAASPALPPSVSLPPVPPTNSTVDKNTNLACDACAPSSDTARHDPTLRLCSGLTGTFTAIVGSLTIRHPAPFIEVSGPNFNPQTGAFDLTGRGSIAGFNNVTVRAVGTMDPSTGRITMSYTMGTAGEFPGGQPITYAITLRKQ